MSRKIEVRFVTPSLALVNGFGMREAITELTGRAPLWSTRSRGWVVQPHHGRDLIAALEHSGRHVITVTHAQERAS